jgi:hypothetical protein
MANEDIFRGARSALTLFFAYQNTVAKEIGMERAITLQTKMSESIGAKQGKMLKEQLGIKNNDAIAALSLIRSLKDNAGISFDIVKEGSQWVVIRNGRCPFYEASQAAGMDAKSIETTCRMAMKFADSVVKQLNPNLSIQVKNFKSAPDAFCDEEIVLS